MTWRIPRGRPRRRRCRTAHGGDCRRESAPPEDPSVKGFDDAPIARLSSVDLGTVRHDPELMGVAAVEAAAASMSEA